MKRFAQDDEALPRLAAAVATVLLLAMAAQVLMQVPERDLAHPGQERMQVRFVARAAPPLPAPPRASVAGDDAEVEADADATSGLDAPTAAPAAAGPTRPPASGQAAAGTRPAGIATALYDRRGHVRLPPGAVEAPAPPATRDVMNPPNPVDYRPTRFDEAWAGNGKVVDGVAKVQEALARLIHGPEVQPARARPSPPVRFNPARHERPSDLGSEATGDAWRAAPISAEPLPGLAGEASSHIRARLEVLERDHAHCDRQRVQALLVPVRQSLDELQRAEHALANGADPVRAATLPATASGAWDQARRALWHARSQLDGCGG